MDKLQTKIRNAEEEYAGEKLAEHLEYHRQKDKEDSLVILGGIRVTERWTSAMSAEALKALIRFQEEKRHECFGFVRFADFLEQSEYSPMTKAQFYERKALFEKEGERMFDLFGEMGLSIRKRKLLGKGNVEIDGENAIIRDADGEETVVPIDDQARLMEVVTAVVDAKLDLQHKYDRQKETIEKQKQTIQNAFAEADRAKANAVAEVASNPHMIARVELGLAFTRLADAASKLSAIEKEQFRDSVLQDVAEWRLALASGYATDSSKASAPVAIVGDGLDEALENYLDSVDLDNVSDDNDGDLAAAL